MNGKQFAMTSMILGIASVAWDFLMDLLLSDVSNGTVMVAELLGLAMGILAIIFANKAKKLDYVGGMRMAGFVCGIIGVAIDGIVVMLDLQYLASY